MNAPAAIGTVLSASASPEGGLSPNRQLQEAIQQVGLDRPLRAVALQIPDARERLDYVGQMTERAAHRVLETVEQAQPPCRELHGLSLEAAEQIRALLADPTTSPDAMRAHLDKAAATLEQTARMAQNQLAALGDIMMSQDFQDLSGQVIKKAIQMITDAEAGLLALLDGATVHHSAAPAAPAGETESLEGPQVPDKAMAQGDVDDLLAELGF